MPIEAFERYILENNIIGMNENSILKAWLIIIRPKAVGETKMKQSKQYIDKNKIDMTNKTNLKEQIKQIFRKKKRLWPSN